MAKRDLTSNFGSNDWRGESSIPPIPTHCGHEHCRNFAAVVLVEATIKSGPKKIYAFSDVCRKTGDNMQPNDGVTFHRWLSWCAHHYMQDIDKERRATK